MENILRLFVLVLVGDLLTPASRVRGRMTTRIAFSCTCHPHRKEVQPHTTRHLAPRTCNLCISKVSMWKS